MEDSTITRPNLVIVLDLQSEADVLARVSGRRVDIATGEDALAQSSEPKQNARKLQGTSCVLNGHVREASRMETAQRGHISVADVKMRCPPHKRVRGRVGPACDSTLLVLC